MTAIDPKYDVEDDFALIHKLNEISGVAIPQAIKDIMDADIRHKTVCDIADMENEVKGFLGI